VTFGEKDSCLLQTREARELSSLQTYWLRLEFIVTYTERIKFKELLQIGGRNTLQTHWLCVELVVTYKEKTKFREILQIGRKKCATKVLAVCRLRYEPWTDTKRGAAVSNTDRESNIGLIQAVSWLWICVISRNKVF
jgi:hypothetical protein